MKNMKNAANFFQFKKKKNLVQFVANCVPFQKQKKLNIIKYCIFFVYIENTYLTRPLVNG